MYSIFINIYILFPGEDLFLKTDILFTKEALSYKDNSTDSTDNNFFSLDLQLKIIVFIVPQDYWLTFILFLYKLVNPLKT